MIGEKFGVQRFGEVLSFTQVHTQTLHILNLFHCRGSANCCTFTQAHTHTYSPNLCVIMPFSFYLSAHTHRASESECMCSQCCHLLRPTYICVFCVRVHVPTMWPLDQNIIPFDDVYTAVVFPVRARTRILALADKSLIPICAGTARSSSSCSVL